MTRNRKLASQPPRLAARPPGLFFKHAPRRYRILGEGACTAAVVAVSSPQSSCRAGWSSLVARQAHNLKVVGSNPTPATTFLLSKVLIFRELL